MTNANYSHIVWNMNKQRILQQKGLKVTPARVALLELLDDQTNPVDALTIVRRLDDEADQATVYRILDVLTSKGLINRLEFGEGKYRYELLKNDHHHLICQNCGSITDVEDKYMKKIEKEIKNKKGFLVKSHSLEFFGVCYRCLK